MAVDVCGRLAVSTIAFVLATVRKISLSDRLTWTYIPFGQSD
jgi:hypothetical protein